MSSCCVNTLRYDAQWHTWQQSCHHGNCQVSITIHLTTVNSWANEATNLNTVPPLLLWVPYYSDVIMGAMASQVTGVTIVYSPVCSGTDKKHQSSASLAFVRGIHRWPVNSPHKGPVKREKMFPFDDVIMLCVPVSVRLMDGGSLNEGRVEIFYGGQWGSVCDDWFDEVAATVVCRQLGYTSGTAQGSALFGPGQGPIHLDDVMCHGMEETLGACLHNGWDEHDCTHAEDVSVICGR